jgi:acetyl-CoA C-acetyltransferase
MQDAVIVAAARTPTGKFLGGLKSLTATQLGALVIREAVRRSGLDPASIEECIVGNVVSAGLGQAPARQAALGAGLSDSVAALTINKVCGSGLKAVMLASQGIAAGDLDVAVAGGMESMSNCPYLLHHAREGLRMGNDQAIDSMINDGLWCSFEQQHMGHAGEVVAAEFHVSREQQDAYAAESHRKAAEATATGHLRDEIISVRLPQRKGADIVVEHDESIRANTTPAALSRLRPAFKPDGTVTAGNAPSVNDGASALVVMSGSLAAREGIAPMARIVAQAASGLAPKYVLMTPVESVRRVAAKAGWKLSDVDLFEINEAFAVQAVAVIHELAINPACVNVNGGAVALGHAIGSTGSRILTTLLYALKARNLRRGIAALCLGGGNGVAVALELS